MLIGDSQQNIILGRGGNDELDGRQAIDQIDGGDGDDTLTGSAYADVLLGSGGDDYIDVVTDYTASDFISYVGYVGTSYVNVTFVSATKLLTLTFGAGQQKSVKLNAVTTKPASSRVVFS